MKTILKSIAIITVALTMVACGNSEKKEKEQIKMGNYSETTEEVEKPAKAEIATDLSNKGIGPVKNIEVGSTINEDLAANGADIFKKMCTACHKMDKKFIGPALSNVTERRSPEWIMNMILNPEQMIKEDPIAKQLLIESNMAVMANQNLTEEEARAVLEYFRKNDL